MRALKIIKAYLVHIYNLMSNLCNISYWSSFVTFFAIEWDFVDAISQLLASRSLWRAGYFGSLGHALVSVAIMER